MIKPSDLIPPASVKSEECTCDYMGGACALCIDYTYALDDYEHIKRLRDRDLREVYKAHDRLSL